MKINSNLFLSSYNKPQAQIKKFHSEMGKTFSTLPKNGKVLEIVKRIVIAILSPFIYLSLYILTLRKSIVHPTTASRKNSGQSSCSTTNQSTSISRNPKPSQNRTHSSQTSYYSPGFDREFKIDEVKSLKVSNSAIKTYPPYCNCTITLNDNSKATVELHAPDIRSLIKALPPAKVNNYNQEFNYFSSFEENTHPSRAISDILNSFK